MEEFIPTETTIEEPEKTSIKVPLLPRSDQGIIQLAETVVSVWKQTNYTLDFITVSEFEVLLGKFKDSFINRNSAGANRSPVTLTIKQLDEKINSSIRYVKSYLEEEFGYNNCKAWYSQYGILKTPSGYIIPKMRSARTVSLKAMVTSMKAGIHAEKFYGAAYWEDIYNKYTENINLAGQHSSDISKNIMTKANYKAEILTVLRSVTALIRANHPFDYKLAYRTWGFQKELY